jgi:PAS domain S-box-containing protein
MHPRGTGRGEIRYHRRRPEGHIPKRAIFVWQRFQQNRKPCQHLYRLGGILNRGSGLMARIELPEKIQTRGGLKFFHHPADEMSRRRASFARSSARSFSMPDISATFSNKLQGFRYRFFQRLASSFRIKWAHSPQDGLDYWRERILLAMLGAGLGLSALALIPAFFLALTRELWGLLLADASAVLATAYLLFFARLDLRNRSQAALSIPFIVGVVIIHQVGFLSGGTAWLFCFSVLAGVLLGIRAALGAILLNGLSLVVLAGLANQSHPSELVFFQTWSRSVTAWANFLFLNALAAVSVASLVNGLQSLNRKTERALADLGEERSALLATKDKLKEEIAVRRDSERVLREQKRRYRLLAESIQDVIWTMDLDFRFTYISPAAFSMQGWTPEELMTLGLGDIVSPSSLEKVFVKLQEELELGRQRGSYTRAATLELELFRKDRSTIWAEVTASFILEENGQPAGILGVTRDITERKKAQEEKDKLLERLNQSKKMEAIGRLAGGVAHDLNNVLSGIVSYPDLLLLDLPKESPLRRPIETIQESGKKAAAIVQDLLTLARRGVAVSEIVNLNDVVREFMASPEYQRLKYHHPLVTVSAGLDPALLNTVGSPVHLSKTIMNLVSNAAEAMPDGGQIWVTSRNTYLDRPVKGYTEVRPGEYTVLQVADQGTGISPEDIQRIFEPFYTKKKMGRSGTGLGMAVVWGTVEDHQGYIDIESAAGRGTTVSLYLPGTRQQAAAAVPTNPLDQYRGHGETVLVVDDLKEQREIAARILTQLGYGAKTAASGEEAVAFVQSEKADLIILDMIMDPGIDGLETYQQILRYNPSQRAIIASGFAESNRVKETQQLGAGAYLRKPYTVEALVKAVKSELAQNNL